MLEVKWDGRWSRVCRDGVSEPSVDGICQRLGCGPPITKPLQLVFTSRKEPPNTGLLKCTWPAAAPATCHWVPGNCTEYVIVICSEPVKTTPKTSTSPPATTPEPTGPARLRLVDGDFGCSGFVELHRQGLWGAVAESPGIWPELAARICQDLRCGTSIDSRSYAKPERGSHLPVRWEVVESCKNHRLLDCFNRTSARRGEEPAFIICSGSQPQALRRLAAGPTPCEGDVEVFHEGRWRVLCDNFEQRAERGRQLCRELRCGNLSSSTEIRDPPSMGVTCKGHILHLCHTSLRAPRTCSRTRVVCQDSKPQPTGTAAGTIVSICLALLLFGILLLICGPPAYRRLMKRISKKKQRQWIGPTGLYQTGEEQRDGAPHHHHHHSYHGAGAGFGAGSAGAARPRTARSRVGRRCERARAQRRLSLPATTLTHGHDINSAGRAEPRLAARERVPLLLSPLPLPGSGVGASPRTCCCSPKSSPPPQS
ncbi:T-cell surface glycoprotein CD5 isoform 2-T2 [Morphnus guianensis]